MWCRRVGAMRAEIYPEQEGVDREWWYSRPMGKEEDNMWLREGQIGYKPHPSGACRVPCECSGKESNIISVPIERRQRLQEAICSSPTQ
jgi:hypothetical protein